MDRSTWLNEMRHDTERDYDTIWAPQYGEKWGLYSNASHRQFLQKFLALLSQPGTVLDAACGTGRYMPILVEKGHTVTGIDQAQGMLAKAREKLPTAHLEKIGLQEMPYREIFDGAICMDAMENVSPEDWPTVLQNFHRAVKPSGYFYFTVEIAPEDEVEQAFREAQKAGLPVVYGEWINDGVYHYYPSMSQVREWLQQAGFEIVEEGEGDGYHHFITRKA